MNGDAAPTPIALARPLGEVPSVVVNLPRHRAILISSLLVGRPDERLWRWHGDAHLALGHTGVIVCQMEIGPSRCWDAWASAVARSLSTKHALDVATGRLRAESVADRLGLPEEWVRLRVAWGKRFGELPLPIAPGVVARWRLAVHRRIHAGWTAALQAAG